MSVPSIFTSKRFITFVITTVIDLIIIFADNPQIESNRQMLIEAITLVAVSVIGGFTLQDAAAAWKGTDTKYHQSTSPLAPLPIWKVEKAALDETHTGVGD